MVDVSSDGLDDEAAAWASAWADHLDMEELRRVAERLEACRARGVEAMDAVMAAALGANDELLARRKVIEFSSSDDEDVEDLRGLKARGAHYGRAPLGQKRLEPPFSSREEYERAWSQYKEGSAIPWPEFTDQQRYPISGVLESDSASTVREKIRAALRRWHPDKWGTRTDLKEKLTELTRALLIEKNAVC